jgi:hypothetical protein
MISCYAVRKVFQYALTRKPATDLLVEQDIVGAVRHGTKEWVSYDVWRRFITKISKLLDVPVQELAELIYQSYNFDSIQDGILRLVPISLLRNVLPELSSKEINTNLYIQILNYNKHLKLLIVRVYVRDRQMYGWETCDYNKGSIIGLLSSKGYKKVHLTEQKCAVDRGHYCLYRIVWDTIVTIPYYTLITNFVRLFVKKKEQIPEYVWKHLPEFKSVDDLTLSD